MNGIDGFLGKPSIVLDARVMSTGAKSANSAGTQADSERTAAFGGHLADLSRQGGNAGDMADLASPPQSHRAGAHPTKLSARGRNRGDGPVWVMRARNGHAGHTFDDRKSAGEQQDA